MFKIAIVEDQEETRESLNRFVRQYAQEQGLQVEISLITDGAEIAEHYTPGFDIIFMDVEMPRLDGFGAAEAIRAVDADVVLVFVTNMAQYAIRGYEVVRGTRQPAKCRKAACRVSFCPLQPMLSGQPGLRQGH